MDHAPRVRSVDPRLLVSLGDFRCGGSTPYEEEVEKIVAMVHAGQHMFAKIRVAEDPANGALLGLCATHNRPFPSDPVEPDAAYVMVIGVNGPVRGWRTPDGNRLGDVLLEDAIRQIHEDWGHGPSPRIWALVDPPNTASHRLFDRHDFKKLDAVPGGYDIRFLPREDP